MRRDVGSFAALKVNNFFLFVLLLIAGNVSVGLPPRSAYPFLLLVGFLLLFPLSSDPLAKIPPMRTAVWPLAASQRTALRIVTVALSPLFWLTWRCSCGPRLHSLSRFSPWRPLCRSRSL